MMKNSYEKSSGRVGTRKRAEVINRNQSLINDVTELSKISVMVTGAGGFVGYPLCQELVNSGYKVYGTICPNQHSFIVPVVKYTNVEIDNKTNWESFFKNNRVPDVIIHLQQINEIKDKKDNLLFKKINRDGVINLASYASKIGVKQFILLSSSKVNGESSEGKKFSPLDTPHPKTAFAVSKWEAEEALKKICLDSKMSYTILRTPSIYGANADGIILSLLKEIAKEIKIPYVNENNIRNLIYVRNLTASIRFLMLNNKSENKVFMVKDAESFRLNEIIYRLAELMDKKVRLVKVPLKGLKLASYMNLSSHSWIQNQMEIDDNDILKTGFKAPYPTFIGFSEMIEWFLVNHKQEKKRRFFIG